MSEACLIDEIEATLLNILDQRGDTHVADEFENSFKTIRLEDGPDSNPDPCNPSKDRKLHIEARWQVRAGRLVAGWLFRPVAQTGG